MSKMQKGYILPSRADVHIERALTQISHAYLQDADGFVADRAFPILPVSKPNDKYFLYDKGDFNRDEMKQRAPSTESAGTTWRLSTDSFSCDVWALHRDVDDQIRATADDPLKPDTEAALFLSQKALLRKETLWAAEYFVISVWDADLTGVSAGPTGDQFLQWNDASSNPIVDIRRGKRRVHSKTGLRPNKLVVSREVYDTLIDHPDIVDRLNRGQTSGAAMVVRRNLAELFEIEEVLVLDAVVNSAGEGLTDVMDYLANKKAALLLYVPASPGLMTPSAGYTFTWNGLLGATALSSRITRMRLPKTKSDRFEIEMAFDQKLAASDLGQFFDQAIA